MGKKPGEFTYAEIVAQPDVLGAVAAKKESLTATCKAVFAVVQPEEVIFTGCGTSYYLAQTICAAFSRYNRIPARALAASELLLYPELYLKERRTLFVPITRSAQTTEVRRVLAAVRGRPGVATMAVSCDPDSAGINDYCLLTPVTAEKSVVMTKSFSALLMAGLFMALAAAGETDLSEALARLPSSGAEAVARSEAMARKIVAENGDANLFVFLGQGPCYGLAGEAMIKMTEMSLANTAVFHSLEYRHGPLSLVDKRTLVVLFASQAAVEVELPLLKELKGLGARTMAIGGALPEALTSVANYHVELAPGLGDYLCGPLAIVPAQMLAYHYARRRGLDLDTPRHLSHAVVLA
ncbi:MAG: SIS domain-containing protein [Bacteroidota bacterium]